MNKILQFSIITVGTSLITLILLPYLFGSFSSDQAPQISYISTCSKEDGHVGGIFAGDTFAQSINVGNNKTLKSLFLNLKAFARINKDTLVIGYIHGEDKTKETISVFPTEDLESDRTVEFKVPKNISIKTNDMFYVTSLHGKDPNVVTIGNNSANVSDNVYLKNNAPQAGTIAYSLKVEDGSTTQNGKGFKRFIVLQIIVTFILFYRFFLSSKS